MAAEDYLTVPHLDRKTLTRIFSKIRINPLTGCWEWQAARINGYGVVWFNGRNESTHRLIFAWLIEPLPRGLSDGIPMLDHIVCDNPRCCNPAHLRLATNVENLERTNAASAVNRRKTHCINGHPLPDKPNRWNGYGRVCVTCGNQRQREAKRAQAAARRAARPPKPPKPILTAQEIAENKRAYHAGWRAKNLEKVRAYARQKAAERRAKLRQHRDS